MSELSFPKAELKEFKSRCWTSKNWFQLNTGSNLETLNTISSETNHVWAVCIEFETQHKFFKFDLKTNKKSWLKGFVDFNWPSGLHLKSYVPRIGHLKLIRKLL